MKKILALMILSLGLNAHAFLKEKAMNLKIELPEIYGGNHMGEVLLSHDVNFNRVADSEPMQKIAEFIYAEGGKEQDGFDPADGEGVLIGKDKLDGVIDTDLVKVKFETPKYDAVKKVDLYPLQLKFRASLLQRMFKRVKMNLTRKAVDGSKWIVYYDNKLEVDGLSLKINALGKVLKMDLLLKGVLVKSLKLEEIETIPESQF